MTEKMIQDGTVLDSPYTIAGEAELSPGESHAVPLSTFLEYVGNSESGRSGVLICPSDDIEALVDHFDRISFVAVQFPKFTDGRGYSHARRLRRNLGFGGSIVAVGDVLRDQLMHMARCGMSAFVLRNGDEAEEALEVFNRYQQFYQIPLHPKTRP